MTKTTPHTLKQRRATAEARILPQCKHEDDLGRHPASSALTTQEHLPKFLLALRGSQHISHLSLSVVLVKSLNKLNVVT